ncbi:spr peptidase. Cysteine peptidase. MEROPS family C40 [Microbulbifer donghaiensis]|uniref:Spr peptidase. Cysteine peptidase. MEROPS family C40 n=1 Tax=Microbulbifer donghaiensis TaxID=494016 RepID=A0A1M4XFG7_9GAMM|nr:NlpC/P60 family protein [Microbulbifer donghaiensis]SHE92130.1 spr peptidase. Cysteine peptidase. MEROPS family C40 [Microbulbifer donghaiensis]
MYKKLLLLLIAFLTAATAGCSLAPYQQPTAEPLPPGAYAPPRADTAQVKKMIYAQYREWKGTRYKLGGLSKRGIDCSGLIYATYRDQLGIELPRTTEYQARLGNAIKRRELRAGDLVFFKTGRKVWHVGIYIEDDQFFHASTKRGVTISRLTDYYWRDKYWHARRLDLDAHRLPAGK